MSGNSTPLAVNGARPGHGASAPAAHFANPEPRGLYDPARGLDSCGVGFVANLSDEKSHQIIADGLRIVENLTHRGAAGADPLVGDGAGMLTQIPHRLFAEEAKRLGFALPAPGEYAVAMIFFPQDEKMRGEMAAVLERSLADEGMEILGWRDAPVDNSSLSPVVIATEPVHRQVFIKRPANCADEDTFERRLYIARKLTSSRIVAGFARHESQFYFVSMSCRTIVYKGMFLAYQLGAYYKDLKDARYESALALVHQRFSTNTFPSWRLAHPYRMIAHNGEINTVRGNVNWMAARQASVSSDLYGDDISKLWPISYEGQSDTACFDNALEFLTRGGYALPHAAMTMIPEAWAGNPLMNEERKAFYEYHAALMEPWDGPAAIAFTDGRRIGATLDRNGLRPARYCVTHDGVVVMASEAGVLPIEESRIAQKWRLQPGLMLLIDLDQKRIVNDGELKAGLAAMHPYKKWLARTQIVLEDLPPVEPHAFETDASLLDRQQAFDYTAEDLKLLMEPMAVTGAEAVGSMGTDTPISALSSKSKLLYTYFKQNFAQVTNPPIDSIREELVMSLVSFIGPRPNLFDLEGQGSRKRLEVRQPILTNEDLEKIRKIGELEDNPFRSKTLDTTFAADSGVAGMSEAVDQLCRDAEAAVIDGDNIIILSDRTVSRARIAMPALLATAAVHHHLIRKGLRTSVGLVVESGEPREVHHFCCLAGYGAEAINPYLAFETLAEIGDDLDEPLSEADAVAHYIKAVGKGILKVMSKMGISTYQSYCGAQIFDAVGLSSEFVKRFFTGTATRIEGVGLAEIAEETIARHHAAFDGGPVLSNALAVGGEYMFRHRGEDHAWDFASVRDLQHAVRSEGDMAANAYRTYAAAINDQSERLLTIRGLFELRSAEADGRKPVPLDEVEEASEIVKRFATGAMSFGSISREAHTTLAIAMNRIGGKSNTGEGGEEVDRFTPLSNGDSMRSAIKQVASGRFGVTTEYLVNSDMMQIKMAQGAKPGEGGQLPGHKVDATIAKVRYSTPGVGLISPPPHHDIYSIEDLKQLIFDLKNVNPDGWVSVKLVSEVGVGTVAAGVAKAKADHVTIAGFEGGTGASPLTSIKHAGSPWEIGLSETHQTLVANELRGRIAVQVDGGVRTGRDVVIGALLGADEFGFSTAPLIAAGCIMMRKCHLNTCPVGIATQDPVLRKRFTGTPEHVINFFFFVAGEVRALMAEMGFRRFDQMIGQMQMLDARRNVKHWKAHGLDFKRLFYKPAARDGVAIHRCEDQDHELDGILDRAFIKEAWPAIKGKRPVKLRHAINNTDRSAGAMLSGEVAKRYGHAGLPDDTIHIALTGTAGQSFGAWAARGVTLDLVGEANDYVGKGLSGGRIVVRPPPDGGFVPEESIIVGNTVLYGAIAGECYFRGIAGERFAVRNSGAVAVVEGAGDHCCEYMTGGVVVVLGRTGRNFAAGMSGGIAYVLDEDATLEMRCNMAMIELEPVPDESLGSDGRDTVAISELLVDLTANDARRLRTLIANHARYTGSPRAQYVLDHWVETLPKFRKVMPVEFRRALAELAEQEAEAAEAAVAAGE
jgi:glutamate synthase (NADPH/NADH) large chain